MNHVPAPARRGERITARGENSGRESMRAGQLSCAPTDRLVVTRNGTYLQRTPGLASLGAINILCDSGGIPGRVGTTMGSATCTVISAASDGALSPGSTVTVWNISSGAVGADKYGIAIDVNGLWEIVVESCG